jgi:cell division protein FtsL
MRLIHLIVVAALVFAAAFVYKIKFDSTVQAERVAKLRTEIRRERESVAALRAEWSQLDNPTRIQGLANRHLTLKPMEATQNDTIERLPDRPPEVVSPDAADPIGAMLDDYPIGSVPATPAR